MAIRFILNDRETSWKGDDTISLLAYLRDHEGITSVKDGCSGQGACGACLLEMDGKPVLSCRTPMKKVDQARVVTIEGFEPEVRLVLGRAFVDAGAVQCGFCTPGFLARARLLLKENPMPSRDAIVKALGPHLCRCTGYVKIIEAIELAAQRLAQPPTQETAVTGRVGQRLSKRDAYETATGQRSFISDMRLDGMLFGVLRFSDHPRAEVLRIDTTAAAAMPGVVRVFTWRDIPGERYTGHLILDWPLMVAEGETTRYIGDVLAGVVADSEASARRAAEAVVVHYQQLEPLTDVRLAEISPIQVHQDGNLLSTSRFQRGEAVDRVLAVSAHVVQAVYRTPLVEHAFLETEAAIARPWNNGGIQLFTQSQGIYEDRRLIARILDLAPERVRVDLIPCGGAFGGKEDLTVQGHAALFAWHLQQPVRVRLDRSESLRMHPKRHPMIMHYQLGCDDKGRLTALKADILGDTGAYASLGPAVMNRAASHAAGGYYVPNLAVTAKALYTNNLPSGAMRGFGVNQVTFAMESAVDELCRMGGFDRWQFRWDNVLRDGLCTTSGQRLEGGTGLRQTLKAVEADFRQARHAGLAVAIKNIGFGNGLIDESEVSLEIAGPQHIILSHGWTEMGQGVDTVAVQIFCEASGIDHPEWVEVRCSTVSETIGGTTTASRGTFLLGNAILDAVRGLRVDLATASLAELGGKTYRGRWACDWTTPPGATEPVTHVAYSYAAQVVILDDKGQVERVVAAHDVGRAVNPTLLEGQIEGSVIMGLGYAFSEQLPLDEGRLKTERLNKLGLLRAGQIPVIDVRIVEVEDPVGPYGVKGIGEIGMIPTAAAAANAMAAYDGYHRTELPLKPGKKASCRMSSVT
jgi:aldehyde oxidoreductase